jgi:hypothetical protein
MMMFSFFKGLAASVDNTGGVVRMAGIVLLTALLFGLWFVCVSIDLNHNDFCVAVIALLPIFAVGNTAFYHRILHFDHLICYYPDGIYFEPAMGSEKRLASRDAIASAGSPFLVIYD